MKEIDEILNLQQVLIKILNKRLIDKFNTKLYQHSINHNKLSITAGKNHSAFNKSYNKCEQLELSSFLRYVQAASILTNTDFFTGPFSLESLLKDDLKLLNLICSIKDYNLYNIAEEDTIFLRHFKYEIDSLYKLKKVSNDEYLVFNKFIDRGWF